MDAESILKELNESDEHERFEAKRGFAVDKSILESVCAFSNEPGLGGGYLILGVEAETKTLFCPVYEVRGIDDPDKIQRDLATQCAELFNRPVRPRVSVERIRGKSVLVVFVPEVSPSEKPIYFSKRGLPDGAFRRVGSIDASCTEDDLSVLYQRRQTRSFDAEVLDEATFQDIDPGSLQEYRRLRSARDPMASELALPDDELLLALGSAVSRGGMIQPNVSGLLLFGTRSALRRFFPTTRVDYVRVQGKEWVRNPDAFSSIDIQRPLIDAIQTAHATVLDDLPKAFSLPEGELQRRDIPLIPGEVIREAIVNAVMHRSYRSNGAIQIVRYSNRLEIINPGYSLKAVERLGEPGSEPRNPHIAAVFHDLKLAEQKGTGIQTMTRRMREAGLQPPHLESDRMGDQFVVRLLFHHFLTPDDIEWLANFSQFTQSDDDRRALIFAREVGAIDNATYRSFSGIDTLTASGRLRSFRDAGLLEMKGKGARAYYTPTNALLSPEPEPRMMPAKSGRIDNKAGRMPTESGMTASEQGTINANLEEPPQSILNLLYKIPRKASETQICRCVLALCRWRDLTAVEIGQYLEKSPAYIRDRYLGKFLDKHLLNLTERPSSKNVRYKISESGKDWLRKNWPSDPAQEPEPEGQS